MTRWFRIISTRSAWFGLVLHVLVYDQTRAPLDVIGRAQAMTTAIFRRVGVELDWVDPAVRRVAASTYVIRLVPDAPTASGNVLGFAVPDSHMASVLYERVDRLAGPSTRDVATAIGHVMAHELGHLLLSDASHSAAGLMRSEFDIVRAGQGALRFSDDQARTIRAAVAAADR